MISYIPYFLLWLGMWLLLMWPVDMGKAVTGVIVAAIVTGMTIEVLGKVSGGPRDAAAVLAKVPYRFFWLSVYLAVFLWECLKANIDVAYRVIHPSLPMRPGTIRVKTTMRSAVGLTLLANSLTLTPGRTTIDVDADRGYLYIHLINMTTGPDVEPALPVFYRYERLLKRICE